jgi:hypothetical protein
MTISVRAEREEHDVSAISHSTAEKKLQKKANKQVFTIFGKANDHESFFFSSSLLLCTMNGSIYAGLKVETCSEKKKMDD